MKIRYVICFLLLCAFVSAPAVAIDNFDAQIYKMAFSKLQKNQWDDAVQTAKQAKNNTLLDVVIWKRLQDDPSVTAEEIATFLSTHENWPLINKLMNKGENDILGRADGSMLTAWLNNFPPQTDAGRTHYLSVIEQNTSIPRHFVQSFASLIWRTSDFKLDEQNDFLARYGDWLRDYDHQVRASQLLWDKKYEQLSEMRSLLSPEFWSMIQARKAIRTKDKRANDLLSSVSLQYQNDSGLLCDLAVNAYGAKKYDNMEYFLSKISDEITVLNPKEVWKYQSILVRFLLKNGYDKRAYHFASTHHQLDGETFAEAEFLAGFIALKRLGWADRALVHFRNLYDNVENPISRSRAAYWLSEAFAAINDTENQRLYLNEAAENPTTFYGQMALKKLNKTGVLPSSPSPATVLPSDYQLFIDIIFALNKIGQTGDVKQFARNTFDVFDDIGIRVHLLHSLVQIGRIDISVALAKRAKNQGQSLVDLEFPDHFPFIDAVVGDKALALALIKQESVFQVDVVSPVGAKGLMQLMPATAKITAKQLGIPYRADYLTSDPAYNVKLGSSHMQVLLSNFNNFYPMAIAAYNAGGGSVKKWINDYGDPRYQSQSFLIDWLESIPFRETRNYVQRVLEGIEVYKMKGD